MKHSHFDRTPQYAVQKWRWIYVKNLRYLLGFVVWRLQLFTSLPIAHKKLEVLAAPVETGAHLGLKVPVYLFIGSENRTDLVSNNFVNYGLED